MWTDALTTDQFAAGIVVAEAEGGDVVGFASWGPEREGDSTYPAELYAIYILQEHQNRGLGRRLVSAVAQSLLADGLSSMLLWVLRGQPLPLVGSTNRWEVSGSAGRQSQLEA